MSSFFEQYEAVLSKNLQQVMLKVDPLNRTAEDYTQYDGYTGYILAETDEIYRIYIDGNIVDIPKSAVIVEGLKRVASDFVKGAAGYNTGTGSGAGGNIVRSLAQGVGQAYGLKTNVGPYQGLATPQSQNTAQQNSKLPSLPAEVKRDTSYLVNDVDGSAAITGGGTVYHLTSIQAANNPSARLVAESFASLFDDRVSILEQGQIVPFNSQQNQQQLSTTSGSQLSTAVKPGQVQNNQQPQSTRDAKGRVVGNIVDAKVVNKKKLPTARISSTPDVLNTTVYVIFVAPDEKGNPRSFQDKLVFSHQPNTNNLLLTLLNS